MKDLINELLGGSGSSNEQTGFVFFNDENPEGYTSQTDFLASLRKQKKEKPYRVKHIKSMFDNMALGRMLMSEPSLSNEDGEEIIWLRFGYGKLRQNLQILNECRMFDFIKDYAAGKIRNVKNFQELLESIDQK